MKDVSATEPNHATNGVDYNWKNQSKSASVPVVNAYFNLARNILFLKFFILILLVKFLVKIFNFADLDLSTRQAGWS